MYSSWESSKSRMQRFEEPQFDHPCSILSAITAKYWGQ